MLSLHASSILRDDMIRRIYPYTRIFVRIFGEYPILPSREYAAQTLLWSILSITAFSNLTGSSSGMLTPQFSGIMLSYNT